MNDNTPADEETCCQFISDHLFPIKKNSTDLIGIETECIAVYLQDNQPPTPVPYIGENEDGLRQLLHAVSQLEGWHSVFFLAEPFTPSSLKITANCDNNLTFEPAGQIEYSFAPQTSMQSVKENFIQMRNTIKKHLTEKEIDLLHLGVNPWHTTEQLGLQIKKPSYLLLQEHFKRYAPTGIRMMRQTCTNQINLDFGADEETLVKRYLACNLLAPYSASIFANSAVWDETHSDFLGFRTYIWREVDKTRNGFPDLSSVWREFAKKTCVEIYFRYACKARVIALVNDNKLTGITFGDWLKTGEPTVASFKEHLYTLFPEVRPRGYLEIRSVDSQAPVWQQVPTAFYVGLIYDNANLERVLSSFSTELTTLETQMHKAINGLQSQDKRYTDKAKYLMNLAINAQLPASLYDKDVWRALSCFSEYFTCQEKTPADEIKLAFANSSANYLQVSDILKLEEQWTSLVEK